MFTFVHWRAKRVKRLDLTAPLWMQHCRSRPVWSRYRAKILGHLEAYIWDAPFKARNRTTAYGDFYRKSPCLLHLP
jgi:hypothetical protein